MPSISVTPRSILTLRHRSGDSDFSPLVSKLKENGKGVIGLGMKDSSSSLLINNCDEFIYYEDLERPLGILPRSNRNCLNERRKPFSFWLIGVALVRENKEVLWSSMVKETMKRKKPSFNESYHGYRTFSDLLADAEKHGIIRVRTIPQRDYVVVGFGKEEKKKEAEEPKNRKKRKNEKPRSRAGVRGPGNRTQPTLRFLTRLLLNKRFLKQLLLGFQNWESGR